MRQARKPAGAQACCNHSPASSARFLISCWRQQEPHYFIPTHRKKKASEPSAVERRSRRTGRVLRCHGEDSARGTVDSLQSTLHRVPSMQTCRKKFPTTPGSHAPKKKSLPNVFLPNSTVIELPTWEENLKSWRARSCMIQQLKSLRKYNLKT